MAEKSSAQSEKQKKTTHKTPEQKTQPKTANAKNAKDAKVKTAKKSQPEKVKSAARPKKADKPVAVPKTDKKNKQPRRKKEKAPSDKLADKTALTKFLQGIFGDAQKKILRRLYRRVQEINKLEPKYQAMSDEELSAQTAVLKQRLDELTKQESAKLALAKLAEDKEKEKEKSTAAAEAESEAISPEDQEEASDAPAEDEETAEENNTALENRPPKELLKEAKKRSKQLAKEAKKAKKQHKAVSSDALEKALDTILPDAFALVREATNRVLEMRPFDVQLIGGMVLNGGNVAEMKTGEGKTLVALLPSYLNALSGRGVHVVTVNDYLAQRDAGWNGPVYDFLGMTVGVIINQASYIYDKEYINEEHEDERFRHLKPCTRQEAYRADVTYGTNNEFGFDYLRDNMVNDASFLRQRELNFAIVDEVDSILIDEARTPLIISAPAGDNPESYYQFAKVTAQLGPEDYVHDEKHRSVTLTDEGVAKVEKILGIETLYSTANTRLVYHLNQALRAEVVFKRDKDYVVTNSGEVIIVDENTGRLMQGRRYNEGLHQAIEAKEGVQVKQESMTLATISFQNFFRLYRKLSGMTGTAFTEAEEFQQIYALDVIQIPPNRKIARIDKDDVIYRTEAGKLRAIVREVKKYHDKGQPVLIGSASIVKNELIARYLDEAKIPYQILNAKNNEHEAAIIAKAGEKGAVTLATNMAGRGTDIKLTDDVKELGGLVVIGSERHDSRRVDNQLRGRGGRQGDPGTTQFFVSCEDDLMRIFQGDRIANLMKRLGVDEDTPIQTKSVTKTLEAAQQRIEGFNFDSRKNVVQYDNVINRHRKVVYGMRRKILEGENIHEEIMRLIKDATTDLTAQSSRVNKKFNEEFKAVFNLDDDLIDTIGRLRKERDRQTLAETAVREAYQLKEDEFGPDIMRKIEREVYLKVLDTLWMQHLENMQHLREGIHWRSVGQRDPLVEYRSESQKLFDGLQRNLREEVLKILLSLTKQEAVATDVIDGEEYDSELTKMANRSTTHGVKEITAGEKNLDAEFKEGGNPSAAASEKEKSSVQKNTNTPTSSNERRNAARKAKKKSRQNKKRARK